MKILHVAKISDNKLNGVNAVVPEYIRYQSKFADIKFINLKKIDIDGLSEWQVEFDNLENILEILKLQDFIPDIVVIHEVNNVENIKLYKILKKVNIPYVIVPHGELVWLALKKKWLKKKLAYLLFFNKFIRKAEAIQCLSAIEASNIKIKTPDKFIATNGIVLPNITKSTFNTEKVDIVYIGRLEWKVKGIDLLIKAVANIKEFMFENKVNIKVYGPDINGRKAEIDNLIAKDEVQGLIEIFEPIFGEEKQTALLDADIFVQTSRHEGMPCGILEALGYGIPCLITKGTNLVEDVCEFDAGYDAGTTEQTIADAIKFAVNDRDNWKNKSAQAVKLVSEKYNWDIVAQNTIEKYEKFIRS